MLKKILSFAILTIFFACATSENYENKLRAWEGRSVNDLISEWGVPDGSIEMPNGTKVYEYIEKKGSYGSSSGFGVSSGYGYGYPGFGTGVGISSSNSREEFCKTSFYAEKDIIVRWKHEGRLCRK